MAEETRNHHVECTVVAHLDQQQLGREFFDGLVERLRGRERLLGVAEMVVLRWQEQRLGSIDAGLRP